MIDEMNRASQTEATRILDSFRRSGLSWPSRLVGSSLTLTDPTQHGCTWRRRRHGVLCRKDEGEEGSSGGVLHVPPPPLGSLRSPNTGFGFLGKSERCI